MMKYDALADAIVRGIDKFRSCNWTHENGRDDEDEPIYCSGDLPQVCDMPPSRARRGVGCP